VRVLLVDDHRLFRDGMKSLLTQWRSNVDVTEVGRLLDAVSALADADFDLILLDLTLPDSLDPEQTVRLTVAGAGDTPVVAVSMLDSQAMVARALQAGIDGFIRKSDSAAVMMSALDVVVAGGRYLPAGVAEPPAAPVAVPALSDRQLEVLRLIAKGQSNKAIARELKIAEATVKVHVHRLLQLIGASSRAKAAAWAHQSGVFSADGFSEGS
jgi:two-component system nitrate/nitrite response regulator NarL